MLAANQTWVNDDWTLAIDNNENGFADYQDIVTSSQANAPAFGVAYGVQAFGGVTGGVDPSAVQYTTIASAIANTNAGANNAVNLVAGTYAEAVVINKTLQFRGPNATLAGNDVSRANEAVLHPNGNTSALISLSANNVTIKGITLDGNDPSLPGTTITGGGDANATYAINTSTGTNAGPALTGLTITNNIIKNVAIGFIGNSGSVVASNNTIDHNLFDGIGVYDFGYAVSLRNNFYANVTDNVMRNVWTGVHVVNFSQPKGAAWSISNNNIQSAAAGAWLNLLYSGATPLNFTGNTLAVNAAPVANNIGLLVTGGNNFTGGTFTSDTITGHQYGVVVYGTNGNNVTLDATDSITATQVGVYATNILGFNPIGTTALPLNNTAATTVVLNGTTITTTGAAGVGVQVRADPGGMAAAVQLTGNTKIQNGATGLTLSGAGASLVGNTLGTTAFTGQTGQYIALTNGAANGVEINGTAATFDGKTGATATNAENYAIEDKITHAVDGPGVGFVRVKAANVFVTTNTAGVQRGIDVASSGNTVNINSGTYNESPTVNKSLTLAGEGRDTTTIALIDTATPGTTYLGSFYVTGNGINVALSSIDIRGRNAVGADGVANDNVYILPGVASFTATNSRFEVGAVGAASTLDDGIGVVTEINDSNPIGSVTLTGNEFVPVSGATAIAQRPIAINAGVTSFTATNNQIVGGFQKAVFIQADSSTIAGNTIAGLASVPAGSRTGGFVVYLENQPLGVNSTFTNNTITNTLYGISAFYGANATLAGNTITGNDYGTYAVGGSVVTLNGNHYNAAGSANDNGTDLYLDTDPSNGGSAKAVFGTGSNSNEFGGNDFFIYNNTPLNYDLTSYTSANFEGLDPTTPTGAAAIENLIYDKLDDATLGLVKIGNAGNTIFVSPTSSPTATDNDYTRIANAINAASAGYTIVLVKNGTDASFDWTEANAAASFAKGNDGATGGIDDYSAFIRAGLSGLTITADVNDGISIIGGGDIGSQAEDAAFKSVNGGAMTDLTFSNFTIDNFGFGIELDSNGSENYSGLSITGMHINVAADNRADGLQTIGIYYSAGQNIHITGNAIAFLGTGIGANPAQFGIQSTTTGGNLYDGLLISNNDFTVAAGNSNQRIWGVWENGHAHTSNITVSGNTFTNSSTNGATTAFRITSESGPSSSVNYTNNTITGASVGFEWLDVYQSSQQDYSGATGPVNLTGNTVSNTGTAVSIGGTNAKANLAGNHFDNATDNGIDVLIKALSGTVTFGAGNTFGGNSYFIRNEDDQNITLTGQSFDESNNFRIEDKMFHALDSAASGLIRFNGSNLYVTTPGTGLSDETIQRAVTAASGGDTVNVEAGTFDVSTTVDLNKGITLLGAKSGIAASNGTRGTGETILVGSSNQAIGAFTLTTGAPVVIDGFTLNGSRVFGNLPTASDLSVRNTIFNLQAMAGAQQTNMIFGFPVKLSFTDNAFTTTGSNPTNSAVIQVTGTYIGSGAGSAVEFRRNSFTGVAGGDGQSTLQLNLSDVQGVVDSNRFDGVDIGVLVANGAGNLALTNNTFTNITRGAAQIAGGSYGAGIALYNPTFSAPVTISGNTFSNSDTGIRTSTDGSGTFTLSDSVLSLAGNTFTSNLYAIVDKFAGTITPTSTNVFDGVTLGSATTAQLLVIADEIVDRVDVAGYGFIDLKPGNVYVTANSFFTPGGTTTPSVQRGVDAADASETVYVGAGTYVGQVSINKSLTVTGAGQGSTTIQSPSTLGNSFTYSGSTKQSVVAITGGSVTIQDLTVDGHGQGGQVSGANDFVGVGVYNANATITDVTVTGVRDATFGGAQRGRAIFVGNDSGTAHTVSISGSTINDYQKNGVDVRGANLTATLSDDTITGQGVANVIAQSGVVFLGGAGGSISTSTISQNIFNPTSAATGILLFGAGNTTIDNNVLTGNGYNIDVTGVGTLSIHNNYIQNGATGINFDSGSLTSTPTIYENYIGGNNDAGINNDSGHAVDATRNYWGAVGGPTIASNSSPGTPKGDKITGTSAAVVAYVPFLTDGTDTSTAIGFQPNAADASPPATVTGLDLVAASDSGDSDSDDYTNDQTPTITGNAEAGSNVILYANGVPVGSAVATAGGTFSITASSLADGTYNFTAIATDAAGNSSTASAALQVIIDATAPNAASAPDLDTLSDTAGPSTGTTSDNYTKDFTPTFSGTAEANATITILEGTTVLGTAIADGLGNYSITTSALSDGSHTLFVLATDLAGNVSPASGSITVIIDTSIEQPTAPDLTAGSDTGASNTDNITANQTPTLTGTAEANSTIVVSDSFGGSHVIGTVTTNASGVWTLVTPTLADGSHTITVVATDKAGNVSVASSTLIVIVDSAIATPSTPDLIEASDSSGPLTGSDSDDRTNDNTPTFTGTGEVGSTVTLFEGSTVLGTGVVQANGVWGITSSALSDGPHTIFATATDTAGNTSPVSGSITVTIDTVAPTAPAAPDLAAGSDTGASSTDNNTSDKTPTFVGTAEAGSTVSLYIDGSATPVAQVVALADGSYTVTVPNDLADGTYSFAVTSTDAAGNASILQSGLNVRIVTIDTVAPNAPTGLDLTAASDSGSSNTDNITNLNPVITGSAEAGSTVQLFNGNTLLGSGTAASDGSFSITLTGLTDGVYTITAKATDAAGNVSNSSSSLSVTYDTTAPSGSITDVPATPHEGDTITFTNNVTDANVFTNVWNVTGVPVTVVGGSSGQTYTIIPNDNGSFSIQLLTTDVAGNTSSRSVTINVLNTAPTPTIEGAVEDAPAPTAGSEGTPISLTSDVADPGLDTFTYLWTVAASNGQVITNGTSPGFTFTPNDEGTYTVTLTVTDDDGGTGTTSQVITVGNVAPNNVVITGPNASGEGATLNYNGSASDAGNDTLTYTYSVTKNGVAYGSPVAGVNLTNFSFTPNDNGTYVVTLTVTDGDGGSTSSNTGNIIVSNVNPTATSATNSGPVNEGGTATVTLNGATDVSTVDAGSLTYSYDFNNDGDFNDAGEIVGSNSNTATVPANFTANGLSNPTVRIRVTDKDGGFNDYTTTITVNNVAPTGVSIVVPAGPKPEGTPITVTGTATDAGGDTLTYSFAVTKNGVAFGTPQSGLSNSFTFTPDDNGSYIVTLVVTDGDGGSTPASPATIAVTNVAPTITSLTNTGPVNEASPVTVNATATDPAGVNDTLTYTYTVTRNGQPYTVTGNSGVNLTSFTFTPNDDGSYIVSLTVTDEDGGTSATSATSIAVADVAPTVNISVLNSTINENGTVTLSLNLVDPGNGDLAATQQFVVTWGDGTQYIINSSTDAARLATLRSGGTITLTHVYADDSTPGTSSDNFTISFSTVQSSETVGGPALVYNTVTHAAPSVVTVNNVAPTGTLINTTPTVSAGSPVSVNWISQDDASPTDRDVEGLRYVFFVDYNNDGVPQSNELIRNSSNVIIGGGAADGTYSYANATTSSSIVIPGTYFQNAGQYVISGLILDNDLGVTLDTETVDVTAVTFRVSTLTFNASGFDVVFNQAFDPTTINLYDGFNTYGAADLIVLQNGIAVRGSLIFGADGKSFTFVKTGGVLGDGAYTVTIRAGANAFHSTTGENLDGDANGTTGDDYQSPLPFNVTGTGGARIVSIPDFTRGPNQSVEIPSNATSTNGPQNAPNLPVNINAGTSIRSIDFTLTYDTTKLFIDPSSPVFGLPSGWSFTFSFVNIAGTNLRQLIVSAGGENAFTTSLTSQAVLRLRASVPGSAVRGESEVLRLTNVVVGEAVGVDGVNDINARGDFAVHQVGYLGDVNNSGGYNSGDVSQIQRVTVGADTGFSAFRNTDPLIIADVNNSGAINSGDASLVQQRAANATVAQIPPITAAALAAMSSSIVSVSNPEPKSASSIGSVIKSPASLITAKSRVADLVFGESAIA